MGMLFGRQPNSEQERMFGISRATDLIPRRISTPRTPIIDADQAMRHSAVWACLRLRADLVSTLPLNVYRDADIDGTFIQIDVKKPPILVNPGGARVGIMEWLYSGQVELDRSGNNIGIIRQTDGNGLPARIDLQPSSLCSVKTRDGEVIKYRIAGEDYDPDVIWHEKQYTISGLPVGLSPVAYAAFTLGQYQSIQQFVMAWFTGGATPRARLKNTAKKINAQESLVIKESWRASMEMGEPFVHGNDWEYNLVQAEQASSDWLEAERQSATDIARFFNVPSDLIDASVAGENVTYASLTERNLQFLMMHLGPVIARREDALTQLLPRPRYVILDSKALLRMDPKARADMLAAQLASRQISPSEARALENRKPFTPAQIAEIDHFWPPKTAPAPTQG